MLLRPRTIFYARKGGIYRSIFLVIFFWLGKMRAVITKISFLMKLGWVLILILVMRNGRFWVLNPFLASAFPWLKVDNFGKENRFIRKWTCPLASEIIMISKPCDQKSLFPLVSALNNKSHPIFRYLPERSTFSNKSCQ